jgi:lipid A 3-O-deacylase
MTLGSCRTSCATLAAVGLLAAAGAADAQTAPGPDTASIWTLQDENASISTNSLTDRFYVNGLRLGYASPEGAEPGFLAGAANALWGDGAIRFTFDLSQQIYTPADTKAPVSPPGDRPYAGVLLGTFGLQRDVEDSRSVIALAVGVVGPGSGAEALQNGFHDLIGQSHDAGWDSQLKNEPLFELSSARTWRVNTGDVAGVETQVLPNLAFGLGNLRVYAQTGAVVRFGEGLDSDYGVARVSPGMSGWDTFRPTRPFVWYVFAGADGQAVAHDITLNGNMWNTSPNVQPLPLVAEFEGGVGLIWHGVRITYTQVVQTQEFKHQSGGLHELGSLALSARF